MAGFVLPDSWSSLSRGVKSLVEHMKRSVETKSDTDSSVTLSLAVQGLPVQAPASQPELPARLVIRPNEDEEAPASANKFGPGSPKPYAVDLRESAFTSVFSLSGRVARASEVVRQESPVEVAPASQEVRPPQALVESQDLEEMERDLSTLSSLTALLNVAAAQEAGFKLSEKAQLRIIKGIGPKTINMLNVAGILTFSDLADCSVNDLRKILQATGPYQRLAKPSSWIQQANLASMNRWDALKALQASGPARRRSKLQAALKSVELNP
jgi:predicted flap endonuclease-1-like 5' DNA nuclease